MNRVILESPFMGRGRLRLTRFIDRWRNIRYARACLRDSLSREEAPMASHLLYTQRGVLDDDNPSERRMGIDAGLEWRHAAVKSVVYVDRGITPGMEYGIRTAVRSKLAVEFRKLYRPITPAEQHRLHALLGAPVV